MTSNAQMLDHMRCEACRADSCSPGDEAERKVALVLEHGLRADRAAAERFVAHRHLQRLDVTDFQRRVELFRMYGCSLNKVDAMPFSLGLRTRLLPLLAFLRKHECALQAF